MWGFARSWRVGFAVLSLAAVLASCQMSIVLGGEDGKGSDKDPHPSSQPSPSPGSGPWNDLSDIDRLVILSVGESGSFGSDGIVEVRFIPFDHAGNPILDTRIGIALSATVDSVTTNPVPGQTMVAPASSNGLPYALTVDLDSSGSMSSTDPNRNRVLAAKTLVDKVLAYRPNSRIRIADFGNGSDSGFGNSRLLSDFSSNKDTLYAAIETVAAEGATPLYESVDELMDSLHNSKPSSDFQRMMFVLSDGEPTSDALKDSVYTKSQGYGIPIHTVFLGTGSGTLTMRELAESGGGIYAGAAESTALAAAFEGIVVGNEQGYMTLSATFAADYRSFSSADMTLTVYAGVSQSSAATVFTRL